MLLLPGDPHSIATATGDPFKTLFVARIVSLTPYTPSFSWLNSVNVHFGCIHIIFVWINFFFLLQNYDSSESKLRREFEVYGPIKKVRIDSVNECKSIGS
jgi:hypothetical protein